MDRLMSDPAVVPDRRPLPRASVRDTARVVAAVLLPTVARGVIVRRRPVTALAERLDLEGRAVATLQRLRAVYGPGPLRLRLPGRRLALVLAPDDARRILAGTPAPFTAANREKRAALGHFQPDGVLISDGPVRHERRRFTETVLDADRPAHRLAGRITDTVRAETRELLAVTAAAGGYLTWDDYAPAFWRIVRRVVLGDAARDDHRVTDLLGQLRRDANWSYLRPVRAGVRTRFLALVRSYLARAEPGSLADVIAGTRASARAAPESQVAHWLFAFDAAGMAAFRALALLATHPPASSSPVGAGAGRAAAGGPPDPDDLRPYLLESVRLWPTTLVILRDTTAETRWDGEVLPAGTGLVLYSPFLHRDDQILPYADRFAPELWRDAAADPPDRPPGQWSPERRSPAEEASPAGTLVRGALVPFSDGPAACPGRNLVLLVTTTMLATVRAAHDVRLVSTPRPDPRRPLPRGLDPFRLEFMVTRSAAA
jgi:cytochrome P450